MTTPRILNALVLGAAGIALALALACSAKSPTAPEQRPGPPIILPPPVDPLLVALFVPTPAAGAPPLEVFFENNSTCEAEPCTHDGARWDWDFGDGGGSRQFEPVHTFQEEGTYLVILTASNDTFEDRAAATVVVTLVPPPPPTPAPDPAPAPGAGG